MNFAVLFSGQGSQKPGMGIDFLTDPVFKETIETCSQAANQDLVAVFKSEHGELNKTVHVQPALVSFELGIYNMLKRDLPDFAPKAMIGLSLGEYGALLAAGVCSATDGISLVSDRAKYMQVDSDQVESGMAALVKPDLAKCEQVIKDLQAKGQRVYLSNYNSPKQVVIGGSSEAVSAAVSAINAQKLAKRVVELAVNGAFHTPLFDTSSQKMALRLKNMTFKTPTCSVISNTTAQDFDENIKDTLAKQVNHPTHFGDCLQKAITSKQINATLEIGPGKTLTSFAHQVDRSLTNFKIGTLAEYQDFIEETDGINR